MTEEFEQKQTQAQESQPESQEGEEQREVPPIAEFPIPLEELRSLALRVEDPEKRREFERFVENVRQACFRYDEAVGRVSDYRETLRKGEAQGGSEIYNELMLSALSRSEVLRDSLNILSRNMKDAGLDNRWREQFVTDQSIGDWALRVVVNRKRQTHKTIEEKQGV